QNAAQGSEGQVVFPVQIIETFCLIPQVLYLIRNLFFVYMKMRSIFWVFKTKSYTLLAVNF
ncbi:hypothetical protein HNP69_002549, partial [Chryseobacterium koreense]|nr:hypothetical protein [Chryseobacterium koreense]